MDLHTSPGNNLMDLHTSPGNPAISSGIVKNKNISLVKILVCDD
jgi:hypothetical protein